MEQANEIPCVTKIQKMTFQEKDLVDSLNAIMINNGQLHP